MDQAHKYYCQYCRLYLVSNSPARLASNLNEHNKGHHPADCSAWTAAGIAQSRYYSGTVDYDNYGTSEEYKPLPQYTAPYGVARNTHQNELTAEDLKFLSACKVKW